MRMRESDEVRDVGREVVLGLGYTFSKARLDLNHYLRVLLLCVY